MRNISLTKAFLPMVIIVGIYLVMSIVGYIFFSETKPFWFVTGFSWFFFIAILFPKTTGECLAKFEVLNRLPCEQYETLDKLEATFPVFRARDWFMMQLQTGIMLVGLYVWAKAGWPYSLPVWAVIGWMAVIAARRIRRNSIEDIEKGIKEQSTRTYFPERLD